jgi:hypothetical protein
MKSAPRFNPIWLRITCFLCTQYFTFYNPELVLALLGWTCLAGFFWQDFFRHYGLGNLSKRRQVFFCRAGNASINEHYLGAKNEAESIDEKSDTFTDQRRLKDD